MKKPNKKSKSDEDMQVFSELLELMDSKINKQRLSRIRNILNQKENITNFNGSADKKELIGMLPFVLTNKNIISSNEDLIKVGKNLGIFIPSNWSKRSKQEIIGRIICQVAEFDDDKLKKFNYIFKSLSPQIKKEDKENFFTEWEKTIKKVM